ncbi:MAG: ImmA/IrrE family metallo-endopeptidase [Gemmataceae bacterium]
MPENTAFAPDWASPPGDTITDILKERGVSHSEFARQVGWSDEDMHSLLSGTRTLTQDIAERLADVLGSTVEFWTTRESIFREDLQRLSTRAAAEVSEWYSKVPVTALVKSGWIEAGQNKTGVVTDVMKFFGVGGISDWQHVYADAFKTPAFRTSPTFASDPGAVTVWLRQGEITASEIICDNWNPDLFRKELISLRSLTREEDPQKFLPELMMRCAGCGVAVVALRAPRGCRASGAARFLTPAKPMILLSGRHLADDHFWFTFFHEAGHVLLHGSKFVFVDTLPGEDELTGKEEDEANQFASDILVPPEHLDELKSLNADARTVMRFARKLGISRGIVVGQLQHRGIIPRNYLNSLKYRFKWK